MTIDSGLQDFLSRGTAPVAKFPTPGTTVEGVVESAALSQQTDLDGRPKVWDDGNPRMQVVVTILTDERDATLEDDDGRRRIFIKGQMLSALKEALKEAGMKKNLEVGATLAVEYVKNGQTTKVGFTAPKVYVARYKTPVASVALGVEELL